MKEKAQNLAEPFRSSVLWIPDNTPIHIGNMSYWVPIQWDNQKGKITLAGDAAHPLPPCLSSSPFLSLALVLNESSRKPDRGQGLNHCILDVLNLVEKIQKIQNGEGAREEEIVAYEKESISRGAEEVQLSVKTALAVHNWAEFVESPLMKHGVTKMS
jgi:2-polyprenyl-6-methoxyphenol hydroxylase-like FAD-dependent oxidoreductase